MALSPIRPGGTTGVKFLKSILTGDIDTVKDMLERRGKALLHVYGLDGCTPFLLACKHGHLSIAQYLLEQGASTGDRDKDPKRQGLAIHYACWGGNPDVIAWLLGMGASLDDVDIVGNTPLLYAIYGGHRSVVEDLQQRGRSLRERNTKNHTAILQAACGGHLHLVEWLINKGFSLAEVDHDGNTALLFAAWGGHRDLMEYLLRLGASLDEKNHNGHSVFLSAANGGRVEIVEWLLRRGFDINETNSNGDTALLLAAYGGHMQLVQRLLSLGATLKDRNNCGFTPLLSAANGGQLEMARWLLDNGASLTECDNDGYTSLILAACGGSIDLVKFFLSRGASLSERNNNGDSALLLAAYCGHVELVSWLLDNGSDVSERNNTGMGLLVSAANGGHVEVVRLILRRQGGSGLEDVDEGGYTPLLLAAQRGHLEVVQFLAAYGANLRARTRRHQNDARALSAENAEMLDYLTYIWNMQPLQIACDARMVDCVHAQLQAGVNPNALAEPSPLQLCTSVGTYLGARPPCRETTAIVSMACAPWKPEATPLFGRTFSEGVLSVFRLQHQLDRVGKLPTLPTEMWLHIASFVDRSWFAPARCETAAMLEGVDTRRAWRKRRFGCDEIEEPAQTVDEEECERPEMSVVDPDPLGRASPALDGKVDVDATAFSQMSWV
eukprot:m.227128 g.227128  ORF g.227128 m.227128 type:complete len:668 (+) comp11542_c0_seq1:246-2249(+)